MSLRRCCAKDCFNSQTTTKGISYFGFPKSEYYAVQWAIAAGREDLTTKSLPLLTKYFLCSEHFTDDCFLDAPDNTKLKKTKNPVRAPIPTIFQNNISKFLPKSLRPINLDPPLIEQDQLVNSSPAEDITTILVIPETLAQLAQEAEEVVNSTKNNKTAKEEADELIDETDYLTELVNESNKELCRLCANSFDIDDLIYIFDNNIDEIVDTILPEEIKQDDELSHLICGECLDKARKCFDIITEFRGAQALQRNILTNRMCISPPF